MTTQEILTRVHDAAKPFAPVLTAADSREYNAESVMRDMYASLMALAADLEDQLRREIAASRGVGNAAKIICAMLKAAEKEHRTGCAYPWIDADGRQCVCDGYQAYRLREHLPLIERPEDAPEPINLDKIFPRDLTGWKHLPLPSANELKSFIATERAKGGKKAAINWSFGPEAPTVNAVYLLNAVTIFPAASEILWNTLVSPLCIVTEQGDALVLPIRDMNKKMPTPTDAERKAIEAEAEQNRQRNAELAAKQGEKRRAEDMVGAMSDCIDRYRDQQKKALEQADKAATEAEKADAMRAFYKACRFEADAWFKRCAQQLIVNPEFSVELGIVEIMLKKLYAGEDAA